LADAATPTIDELAGEMIARGVRRVHVLAWRDLDDPDAGGSEIHADEFMRRWVEAGLEITHRTSAALGQPSTSERNGYRVIRRGSRYSVFPRAVGSEWVGRMGGYDALVEVWNGVPWMSPLWCRKPHITFLHHVHGPMWDQLLPRPLAGVGRALEARIAPPFSRKTLTLTPSEATRDDLLGLGFRPDRVVAVNNGVDPMFLPGGRRSSTPLVLCVARLAPVKRQVELIEAAVVARRRVPELQLTIVGDGPLRPALEARVAVHGAQDWVRFAGQTSAEPKGKEIDVSPGQPRSRVDAEVDPVPAADARCEQTIPRFPMSSDFHPPSRSCQDHGSTRLELREDPPRAANKSF